MSSHTANNIAVRLLAKPLTRIHGRPDMGDVDILEKEVARAVSQAKTTRFTQGKKYGHLVMIIGQTAYRTIIGDNTFAYDVPDDEGAYDTTNIVGAIATSAASKAQAEAEHKRRQEEYYLYLAVETAARQLVVEAIDEELLVEIYDDFIQYEGKTPAEIIKFLRDHVCLAATTDDQLTLQAALMVAWDQTENILSYFKKLDVAQKAMVKAHVPCEDQAKAIQAAAQMTASGLFSEEQITEWEEKSHADKNWTALKAFFSKIYKSKMQFSKGEARRNGHESVNAMKEKNLKMEADLEQYLAAINEKATSDSDEINAIKEDQKSFVTMGKQLVAQMQKQQEMIETLSKKLADKENSPPHYWQSTWRPRQAQMPNLQEDVLPQEGKLPRDE